MSFIYMSVAIEERQYTLDEYLVGVEENPRDKEVVLRLNATDIVILSFVFGAVLSLIIALSYKVFTARKVEPKDAPKGVSAEMGYAGMLAEEDFDYPYEDIGDALRR